MSISITKDVNSDIRELSIELKNLFLSSSSNEATSNKWLLLKEYHNKFLRNSDFSITLLPGYHSIALALLESLNPILFSEKWQEDAFDNIFIHGIHHESFLILVRKLEASCESYQQQKILELLGTFLIRKNIDSLMLFQCQMSGSWDPKYIAISKTWNDLITFLGSLPERVANKTKGCMPKIFQSKHYVSLLASSIMRVMGLLHQRIVESQNCTLEFLGKLVGKLSTLGFGDIIVKQLCLEQIKLSETDFIWRRLSQNLIMKLPSNALEPFITNLLLIVPWYGYMDWILGDAAMENQKLNYIMKTKLLHIRYFQKETILQNILGYFAFADNRKSEFESIFITLLKTWSDESALNHQNFEQQKYLASALIIGSAWLKEIKYITNMKAHVDKVLHGTTIRVGNSEERIRSLGMIVSGILINTIDSEMQKLEYENVVNQELLREMKCLAVLQSDPGKDSLCLEESATDGKEKEIQNDKTAKVDPNIRILEIESDDDLEPYDLSKDKPMKSTRPFYLNDCLKGLIEQQDADWFKQCLNYAETLIEANPDTVHEVAVEMAKVLLHMENKFALEDFQILRQRTLISLTVHCPILVADYLTKQFYERDYNINQRLDILEILSTSSQQLSQPKSAPKKVEDPVLHSKEKSTVCVREKMWKTVIEQRIASKTRRISKTPRNPMPEMTKNRFSTVAGYFFYPLLSEYDKKNKTLQLLGEDSYVLGRLTYTLGTVMYAASNIPACKNMGLILLQFLVDIRNHTDVFVREAALFATAAVFTSIPGYLLFSEDMTAHVIDSQHWLQSVIEKDPETKCQLRASYMLSMILRIMKTEMPLICDILATEEK